MTDDANNSPPRTRRSSFAGQTFADIFGTGRASMSRPSNDNSNSPPNSYSGPITNAAAQAQRRRLSLTTLGLSSTAGTAFGAHRSRNDSLGSADNSIDECAVEDGGAVQDGPVGSTPFARRVSFGARAMMDMKTGTSPQSNGRSSPASASNGGSRAASVAAISSRDVKGRGLSLSYSPNASLSGEGFNWSDNFRTRAERTSNAGLPGAGGAVPVAHQRAKSVAVMEPPIQEAPREQKRPDHFQERILKGDFYMD